MRKTALLTAGVLLLLSLSGASYAAGESGGEMEKEKEKEKTQETAAVFSPAMEVLGEKLSMTKNGLIGHDLAFTSVDFDTVLGYACSSVTLLSLPDAAAGTLLLSEKPVTEGQVIPRGDLDELCFVPVCTAPSTASFTYGTVGTGSQYEIECRLHLMETLNFAPTAGSGEEKETARTYSGISCFGSFHGEDPEGDELHFEITGYPRKGVLFTDGEGGYRYAPTGGFTGGDEFRYVCIDKFGNRSEEIPVSVRVSPIDSGVFYSDMRDHPAGVAATRLAEKEIMTGRRVDGKYIFAPDESVTGEEFVAALMSALGVKPEREDLSASQKADAEGAAEVFAPYLTAAERLGYLKTAGESEVLSLNPAEILTRSTAAELLAAAAGLDGDVLATFAPEDASLPASAAAMDSLGILDCENPSAPMTRAQTALSVCALLDYLGQ